MTYELSNERCIDDWQDTAPDPDQVLVLAEWLNLVVEHPWSAFSYRIGRAEFPRRRTVYVAELAPAALIVSYAIFDTPVRVIRLINIIDLRL